MAFSVSPEALEYLRKFTDRRGANECWPWTGTANSKGYGQLRFIAPDGSYRNVTATRVAWAAHHGKPFPSGMQACHTCDNPCCVNPAHIWPGSNSDNQQDAMRKGRKPSVLHYQVGGVCRNGHALTEETLVQRISKGKPSQRCLECERHSWRTARARRRAGIPPSERQGTFPVATIEAEAA